MLNKAREVIRIEAEAVKGLASQLDHNFLKAIDLIAGCQGRVIITGMGKTGIIARKIAATLSSTGTPSTWMHSAEAIHGDLGQVTHQDILMFISASGETEEINRLLPLVKKIGVKTIAMTGNPKSNLAKFSDVVLSVAVRREACPLGLAPMSSTTATLVMGDALAACLIVRKGFKREDFAFFHPGGQLGRRLLLTVGDLMRKSNHYPHVRENTIVKDVLLAITQTRCGSACIINKTGRLVGIFTDGDLRRHLKTDKELLNRQVKTVMTRTPMTIRKEKLAVEAFHILKDKNIDELPVVDKNNKSVGLLDIQDLLKAGLF